MRQHRVKPDATPLGETLATIQVKPGESEARTTWETRQADRNRALRDRAWEACRVPQRHAAAQVVAEGDWKVKLDWLTGQRETGFIVALLGPRGVGKTQLAVEVLRQHVQHAKRRYSGLYVRANEIFIAIKETYGKGTGERESLMRFKSPGLLVIDEAHDRGETDWENRNLTYMIDCRYGDMLDTLLIANQTPEQFKASMGASVYSRLIETGGIIDCSDWPNLRRQA